MAIQILPEHIANQIAAGEVVEGPSSIIKELVENSIDAGASRVDITLSKQLLKIQVVDNGSGMSTQDLELAFKRHATSKLRAIEDLYSLATQGFRGEALASIAAVSRLTCISKRAEDDHASKIYIENDQQEMSQAGAATGTKIIVDDLFFNTPARLKFLKSSNKERNLVVDLVRGLALTNTQVALSLTIDERTVLKTSGSAKLQTCLGEIFSESISEGMLELKMERNGIQVTGFSSQLHITRSDKRGIFTIVNGRYVSCYILRSALEAVYRELLPPGKHPIAVVQLTLDKGDVDVNVHPNKKELKYRDTNKIYSLVGDAVSKALADDRYDSQQSFQPSFQEHQTRQSSFVPIDTTEPIVERAPVERPNLKQFEFKAPVQSNTEKLSSEGRKFVSRFGSLDISVVNGTNLETVMDSLGNKTSFEIVCKNDKQSVLMRGDFIGESWLKDKYLGFLHELGDQILERQQLQANFSKPKAELRSRPQAKPKLSQLEEIWQRDNYSCVYCGKALLHPELVKESLAKCSDPQELNAHLASYDHHQAASKAPELNLDSRNLYACCQECNIKKSDSLATKTWTPMRVNSWQKNLLEIGGLTISQPK
ncbi:MAG: DNA mismatch repair endonuclease MutL [Candidatus Melainabacteria bacterium]|nr:DNA mismatch repair endonuclease MutL [Candidatus Melainabacteria bacterium]